MRLAKLLRIAIAGSALVMGAFPRFASAGSKFGENKRVAVSTVAASPTLISAGGDYTLTTLKNGNTHYLLIGDANTTFSKSDSTGTARITNERVNLDGYNGVFDSPYRGDIYGVAETTDVVVDVTRVK